MKNQNSAPPRKEPRRSKTAKRRTAGNLSAKYDFLTVRQEWERLMVPYRKIIE